MTDQPVSKSDSEWRSELTAEQYHVTREGGTERAFSGEYWNTQASGVYHCVCCRQPLYGSEAKYDSGSGWPSYWQPITSEAVRSHEDRNYGMVRTELLCSRCGAHRGHRFEDGPKPTGERHCINSASLKLEPQNEADPQEG